MKTLRLTLLVLAAAAVTGCMTAGPGYSYRGGQGDYYYGQPSVDYRYHGGYGGYPYYGRSGWSFGLGYGYGGYPHGYYGRYPYGYPYYGYPYGYPYYRPPVVIRPGGGHDRDDDHDDRDPPWRDLDELRRRQEALNRIRNGERIDGEPSRPTVTVGRPPPPPRHTGDDGDSRMGSMVRRAQPQQAPEPRRHRIRQQEQ